MLERIVQSAGLISEMKAEKARDHTEYKAVRAVIYARSARQDDKNGGIARQIRSCTAYIKEKGWVLRGIFADNCAAINLNGRPEFSEMLNEIRNNSFDVMIIASIDRLSRKKEEISEIAALLSDSHVKLQSVNELDLNS